MVSEHVPAGDEPRSARRAEPAIQPVRLGCGHWFEVNHPHGDRRVTCPEDGTKWVVTAQERVFTAYEVRQAPPE